jgi:Mg2+ and Co2+ transporter CorA
VESLNDGSTHRVTVESLGVNVESNWTHVPHGYKNEPELIKKLMDRIVKQEADVKEKVDKEKYLIEDLKDLVDMFATGNVDLRFYKKVIKDYYQFIQYDGTIKK